MLTMSSNVCASRSVLQTYRLFSLGVRIDVGSNPRHRRPLERTRMSRFAQLSLKTLPRIRCPRRKASKSQADFKTPPLAAMRGLAFLRNHGTAFQPVSYTPLLLPENTVYVITYATYQGKPHSHAQSPFTNPAQIIITPESLHARLVSKPHIVTR